jgi:hypothetical protein
MPADQTESRRTSTGIAGAVTCASAILLIFVLPLAVPVAFRPAPSASYVAGFNNHSASMATSLIAVAVMFWSWLRARPQATLLSQALGQDGKISPHFASSVIALSCTFVVVAASLVARSHLRYLADAGYFIEQMSAHTQYHRALYSQLEFAYGPLLFYPTVLLHDWFRLDWLSAYFTTLALDQSLGLILLTYMLNELPIRPFDRHAGLLLLAFGALNPLLGLNYTFLRFITPFALLLISTRARTAWRTTLSFALSDLLLFGLSFELGLAFVFGVVAFAMLRAWRDGWIWLLTAVAPAVAAPLFLSLSGRPYLHMLKSFSQGALNLPVAPYPHILVFLFAVLWLVPRAAGATLRSNSTISIRFAACFALGIGLLPPALGRCDPLHVFFNGAGIFVLSLVSIAQMSKGARAVWLASLLALVLWEQWVNNRLLLDRTIDTVRLGLVMEMSPSSRMKLLNIVKHVKPALADRLQPTEDDEEYDLDLPALEHFVGNTPVATPVEVSPIVEDELKRSGHYKPSYFAFGVDVMSTPQEEQKIQELNQSDWALLPGEASDQFLETPANLGIIQGFAFPYPMRHPVPYYPGRLFGENIAEYWKPIQTFGPYELYRRDQPKP